MLRGILPTAAAWALAVGTLLALTGSPALAHERRAIGDGEYMMVVGFLNEPAFVNGQNGLDLRIFTVAEGVNIEEAEPEQRIGIEGLEETLQAEVSVGGSHPMPLTLEPRFRDPGAYDGHFFPTATGDYTFHIVGSVDGLEIDETFTSSPEGFSSVEPVDELQYPEQVPSNQELASQLSDSGGDDDSNTVPIVVGIIGIVLGAAGLGAGGLALMRRA
jgi:hypothetical protein